MQSRRNEEQVELSPTVKLRSQRRAAAQVGSHDAYPVSRRDVMSNRSPPSRGRRSYSPNTLDVSRRGGLARDRMSGSMEGRDSYGWHLGSGSAEKARSRSPPYEQIRKRPHFEDERVVNRKYDYVEPVAFDDSTSSRVRSVFRYDHGTSRMGKEKDYLENRVTNVDGHLMMGQKLIPVEDFATRGPRQLPQDLGPSLNYAETSGQLPLSSRGIDIDKYEHEKFQHRETIPSNKVKVMDSYKEDKPMYHSQDVAYSMVAASHSKDFVSTPQLKDFAGTSSGITRTEFLSSYQDDAPVSEEYLRSSRKLTEPVGYNKYDQRQLTDAARDSETARRNMILSQQEANSPSRAEYEDNLYRKPRAIGINNHGYSAEDLKRMMPSQSRVSYEHASIDYGHRDMSKPNIFHHVDDRIDNTDDSFGNLRKGTMRNDRTLQKQISTDYIDMSRSYASMQGGEYVGSEDTDVAFRRRLPQDYEMSLLDASHNRQVSNLRSDYGFGRGAGPEFQNERVINSPAYKYEAEQCRLGPRPKRMEEELDMYSDRIHKRQFLMEEDVGRPSSKTIVSSKLHSLGDFGGPYDSEEQIDEDIIGLHASKTKGYGHNEYKKVVRTYDGQDHRRDLELDDWYASQGSLAHSERVPIRFYKNSGKYIKGNPRPGYFNWLTSHHNDRSNLHKQNKVWKRNEDYDEDINANDGDMTEDLVNYAEAELSEDSEEFKQLVHEAFLKYSKKLNLNQSVRRRYKEQGHAGSLFCIVCGRSYSKEFMDTQRLVTHAFMSHKVGLRAQHLGLHKAICVLLGWDSIAPPDTITWVPHALPEVEAFAQKEDLVLWPPIVVIHNISMANNNPQEQKVVPIEGVQAFLRGEGFVGGKITVCLGRPADQSIMVVKFLGTFTGLAMAERLQKYFVENKRGRVEFQRITLNNDKSSIEEIGIQGDKLEEQLLYGYMAIAEDLDKLDFHNRKWCLVKSKKEIQDLANDPVKIDER
ncbi:uncharacterized protein LOC111310398 [Durio zibethinus]|uniref:Uncharacterized protein LOC111310398 n=1 Tax=Durio zibethinus TaxID=66656 RepID=A0A6P6AL45_DURZI|nr:uncharacterized protein LOC111310398 [Durio zibethinus]XP_022765561.1 uncharacterized protein LOC111310398 [Durio zibethinus]